jgi:hypothetical protein
VRDVREIEGVRKKRRSEKAMAPFFYARSRRDRERSGTIGPICL